MLQHFKKRINMVGYREESFKPPLHSANQSALQNVLAFLRRFLDLQFGSIWRDVSQVLPEASGTVLDIGCGAQPFRHFLRPETTYIGIDTVDSKANFGYQRSDTLYFSGYTLPVDDKSADFILCTETLEHILDPTWLLNEMSRCLKSGGNLLLTVPFAARWHFIPFDYWRYTPSSLFHLFDQAGFTNIQVYSRGNAFTVACYKVIGILLPFIFSPAKNKIKMVVSRLIGLTVLPLIVMLAAFANMATAHSKSAEDCLGYTVFANKK